MTVFRTLLLSIVFMVPMTALAQAWPAKPVRIVVAYPPGGGIDVMGRQIAERLGAAWGQPAIVENRPGANTIVATDLVAKSAADGYTVLMTTDATFSINPHLYAKLPFDPQRDFVPVSCVGAMHSSVVEYLVRAGAGGVLIVSCPPRDCWNREGVAWLLERTHHGREAELRDRVDRRRVSVVYAAEREGAALAAELDRFRRQVRRLEGSGKEHAIDIDDLCVPPEVLAADATVP